MKKRMLLILLLVLCSPIYIFAETIVLKNGKTVEGKLIEKTDKHIEIDFQGVSLEYFFDEIKTIDGIQPGYLSIDKRGNKCEVQSKKEGFEEGEELVYCPNSISYIHTLYDFAVVLPAYWRRFILLKGNLKN